MTIKHRSYLKESIITMEAGLEEVMATEDMAEETVGVAREVVPLVTHSRLQEEGGIHTDSRHIQTCSIKRTMSKERQKDRTGSLSQTIRRLSFHIIQ